MASDLFYVVDVFRVGDKHPNFLIFLKTVLKNSFCEIVFVNCSMLFCKRKVCLGTCRIYNKVFNIIEYLKIIFI